MPKEWIRVARMDDIAPGGAKTCYAGDARVVLCRVGDDIHAVEDVCTHDDGPLGAGTLVGWVIECPRHGAQFDVRTGDVVRMPAVAPVLTFPVEVRDGEVYVEVETES
jgi:3-phenylpropionate/trans-cinnamate dioxygenase ferredoxin subunit